MRARFINEKFSEKGDPIVDLGIGAVRHLQAIKNALDTDDMESMWNSVEEDKEELTLRFDANDYYDTENFNADRKSYYDWDIVGVHEPFQWDYYIDVILNKNQVIRSSHYANLDIDEFDYWDEKILVNNAMDMNPEEIADIVFDDWNDSDVSYAARTAWKIANAKDEKEQKISEE